MSDTEAKTHEASAQKLRKQRGKGSVAQGSEVAGLVACAMGVLVLASMAGMIWDFLTNSIRDIATLQNASVEDIVKIGFELVGWTIFVVVGPLVGVIFAVGFVISLLYNGGFVFSLDPVKPQLSRVSMTNGMKRVYGRRGWLEFGVSSLRLIVWFLLAGFIGFVWLPEFLRSPDCGTGCVVAILHPMVWVFLVSALAIMLIASGVEAVIQRNQFLHEQKMTKTEVKRERKDQSGSPEIQRERRRLQRKSREAHIKPGVSKGNMYFYAGDKAILVRYMPPEETEPYVVAKVRGADNVIKTLDRIDRPGVYHGENPEIVQRLWPQELGDAVDAQHIDILAQAMRKLFAQ